MANLKISQLEKAINVNADAYVLVVQNGKNYRMSIKEAIAAHADIKVILITYSELVELRNHSALIQGMQYRIIDYKTTVTYPYYAFGYPFDIIVTAISTSELSSVASALHRDGESSELDDYDLSAWKLKYSLDNDPSKFNWANTYNGKGVIYYLEDEFGNQAPYDFYSISSTTKFDLSSISFIPKHLFPWPYTGKSYNNTIRLFRNQSGQLAIPYDVIFLFGEDVHDIEVSKNSKGEWVAYNKADLFSTSLFDPDPEPKPEPPQPYAQSDGTVYYIGEI